MSKNSSINSKAPLETLRDSAAHFLRANGAENSCGFLSSRGQAGKWIRVFAFSITFGFLAFSKASYADAGTGSLLDLERLVKQEHYKEAFKIAQNLSKKYSGEAHFDYLFALAAVGADHPEFALFPLERILLNQPNDIQARFELGKVYIGLSDNVLAKFHLETARHLSTDQTFITLVDHYLLKVNSKLAAKNWKFEPYLSFNYGRDSNVSSITLSDSIYIDNFQFLYTLDPTTVRGYDFFYDSEQGLNFTAHPFKHGAFFANLKLKEHLYNTQKTLNEVDADLSMGLLVQSLPHTFRVPVEEQLTWIGGQFYRKMHSAGLEWTYWLSNQDRLSAMTQFSAARFSSDDTQNINTVSGALSFSFGLETLPIVFTPNLFVLEDHALNIAGLSNGRVGQGIGLGLNYSLTQYQLLNLNYSFLHSDYKGLDPTENVYRYNNQTTLDLSWSIRMNRYLQWVANGNFVKNNSNVPLYQFTRLQVSGGFKLNY